MPRVFVSVALLVGLLAFTILRAAVWGEHKRWQTIEQYHLDVQAERRASTFRARKLQRLELSDQQAWMTIWPSHAKAARRRANELRQELGLPIVQYPPIDSDPPVAPGVAEATVLPERIETPRDPEIPRVPDVPPWLRINDLVPAQPQTL